MKDFACKSNIGAGLFSSGPVPVRLNFPDGSYATFSLNAITQDVVVELIKLGVKLEGHASAEEALANSKSIIERIVVAGEWHPVGGDVVSIDATNRGRIVSNAGLTAALINAARALAEEIVAEEEGNSGSSSVGNSRRTGGNTGGTSSGPAGRAN